MITLNLIECLEMIHDINILLIRVATVWVHTNSVKDLTYIQDLLKDFPEAKKIAEDNKNYFQKAVDDGYGENFISELIDKNN